MGIIQRLGEKRDYYFGWITYESWFLFKEIEQSIYMLNNKGFSSPRLRFSRRNTERKKINI